MEDSARNEMNKNDAFTLDNTLTITAGYTLDSFYTLGKFPILSFYYVIIHANLKYQEKHFPLFEQMTKNVDFLKIY